MFCDNLECMAYYKQKFSGEDGGNSGGGGGGSSANGMNIVRYAYGMPATDIMGMPLVKVSDLTPKWQEMKRTGVLVESVYHGAAGALSLGKHTHLQPLSEGFLVIGERADLDDENPIWHFMVVPEGEEAEMVFGAPIEKGIYFCGLIPGMAVAERINEDYQAFLFWGPPEVTDSAD